MKEKIQMCEIEKCYRTTKDWKRAFICSQMTTNQEEYKMKQHTEIIKCPACGLIQPAVVKHTLPWYSYVHHCVRCKHVITESEWEIAEFPRKEKDEQ